MRANRKGLLALDADGVMLDYGRHYGAAWSKFTGRPAKLVDALAYHPQHRWGVPTLKGPELAPFRDLFDDEFWSSVPAVPGALEACEILVGAGCELVCVTALSDRWQDARLRNLQALGFPISIVHMAPHFDSSPIARSPKADILTELNPVAFVDDFLPYLRGVPPSIHCALVMREPNGNPNVYVPAIDRKPDSSHSNLFEFAKWWVS